MMSEHSDIQESLVTEQMQLMDLYRSVAAAAEQIDVLLTGARTAVKAGANKLPRIF